MIYWSLKFYYLFLDHKRRRKSKESASGSIGSFHSKLCFFGVLRIEVWVLVPLVVVPLAAYSLSRHTSKCLYPFLVVSVIHSLVSFGMTIIVGCFSLLCFDQLKEHFAQQRKQHEQQLKQSTAIGLESRVHSLASATADFKGTQTAIGTLSHPMECSQCISEIRQLDQFSELRASFRQC
ncbi:hypothetical protein Mgra_00003460 [Meloidogyne graminicola]|uniref:Uncharacterized protein n=1 Tax=Meloidogyne graminicola TaxID=189291 RepID=A0A8S9ZU15_9BILA|nr:hypothetical protein Mgra_00003460 [Meloidogyne graminicola]